MTDIVERLRKGTGDGLQAWDWMREAADEIKRLRAALDRIAHEHYYEPGTARGIARAALKGGEG